MLRPRQIKAIDDVRAAYRAGYRAPLLCAATGFGKTHTAAEIIKSAVERGNDVWFLAHLREILDDTARRLEHAGIEHGFVMAGMPRNPFKPVQVVSVQTAVRRPVVKQPGLIIIDECHLAVANTYQKVLAAAGNPPILGLTGTPCRLDGRGLRELFDIIIPTCSTGDLIAEGLLAPIRYYAPTKVDLTSIRQQHGDYSIDALAAVMDQPSIIGDAVDHYRRYGKGRRAVAFCINIEHAEHTAGAFRAAGFRAVAVSGKSSRQERKAALDDLRSGAIDIVCNCALWVAGVDCPEISCVILLRPTKSLTIYLQAIGRGLRIAPGKDDLLVLDHASCIFEHGLPQDPRQWSLDGKPKGQGGAEPVKQCPSCYAVHNIALTECPCCGHIYETDPREIREGEGELEQIDENAVRRRQQYREQAKAQSLEELIRIGRSRGYSYPEGWARKVWAARQRKRFAA